jgi:hypothetical protein
VKHSIPRCALVAMLILGCGGGGSAATSVPDAAGVGGNVEQGGGPGAGGALAVGGSLGAGGIPGPGGAPVAGRGGSTTSTSGSGGALATGPGGYPSRDPLGRYVAMVAPTSGEAFVAPATLRLVGVGHDPNVYTNSPRDGLGGNAARLQFFVDDTLVLEVDGANAEYWVFKGFTSGVAAGSHQVWARAIYLAPDEILDSPPVRIEVAAPPTYAQVVELTADVVLAGATGYELRGTSAGRIRLNGNGHRIVSNGNAQGPLTLQFVDVFDLGPSDDLATSATDVTTTGAITIEDSRFDTSSTIDLGVAGSAAASLRRNLFRSNMRMPLGQYPDTYIASGASYPVLSTSGGSGVFAGNNVGAGYVVIQNAKDWVVGGDTDADSNVLVGPRVGLSPKGTVTLRRNYSHHVYYGGWSQGANFELGGGAQVTAEHNVISGSSWPVRGVGGQFRYNLVLEAGHEWLWADTTGGNIHHNVFVGGEADVGGIYVLYEPTGVAFRNNTLDGLSDIGLAVKLTSGSVTLTSNLFYRVPSPAISVEGGTLTADYNLFWGPATSYSDGRATPSHDRAQDPQLSDPPSAVFDLDEQAIWQRTLTTREVLAAYRARYLPAAGSPAIDTGDPAGGAGNDIGAVGAGIANASDQFGILP